jgi:hypothetical protein
MEARIYDYKLALELAARGGGVAQVSKFQSLKVSTTALLSVQVREIGLFLRNLENSEALKP